MEVVDWSDDEVYDEARERVALALVEAWLQLRQAWLNMPDDENLFDYVSQAELAIACAIKQTNARGIMPRQLQQLLDSEEQSTR